MKILFAVIEHAEDKPVYLKTEAEKGGLFVIDDAEMNEKKFYGKLLFQLEQSIKVLKNKMEVRERPWKAEPPKASQKKCLTKAKTKSASKSKKK